MALEGLRFLLTDFRSYLIQGGKKIVTPAPNKLLRNPPEGRLTGFSTLLQPDGDVIVRGPRPYAFLNEDDWQRFRARHEQQVQQFLKGLRQSLTAIMSIFAAFAGFIYTLCVISYESEQYGSRNVPEYFHFIYTALLIASFVVPGWKDFTRRIILRLIFSALSLLARIAFRKFLNKQIEKFTQPKAA